MLKRRKAKIKRARAVKPKSPVNQRTPGFALFSSFGSNPDTARLTRVFLAEKPCSYCGALHKKKEKQGFFNPTSQQSAVLNFNPEPYLAALLPVVAGEPESQKIILRGVPEIPSVHTISIEAAAPAKRSSVKKSLFPAGDLPELHRLAPIRTAEAGLPAMEERLRLLSGLPAGLFSVGREAAAHTLHSLDRAAGTLRKTVLSPALAGESHSDVLPTPNISRYPKSLAFASGVPKNLPVETATATVTATETGTETAAASLSIPYSLFPTPSFLDRLERVHENLLEFLRRPAAPWAASAAFAFFASLAVLPIGAVGLAARSDLIKDKIMAAGQEGVVSLLDAGAAVRGGDPQKAATAFNQAAASLGEARSILNNSAPLLKSAAAAIPGLGDPVRNADRLLVAADSLSRAGERFSRAAAAAGGNLLYSLARLSAAVSDAGPEITRADAALSHISLEAVPSEYRPVVRTLRENVRLARLALADFSEHAGTLAAILGADSPRRYLVLFQNSNELRPTGGFIGSIAEVSVDKGAVTDLRVPAGGAYDLQGDLRVFYQPPPPLRRLTGRWQFHDANWFPDFPTSARLLADIYQKSGGPSVDGVVAVNSEILPRLLELTGPIAMPAYRRTITKDNVISETQAIVESEESRRAGAPKKFIGELLAEVLERLRALPTEKLIALGGALSDAFREKIIQVVFFEEEAERFSAARGWSGELYRGDADSLMLVDTNIGGGKTDAVVTKVMKVSAALAPDGAITNTVTLSYEHRGRPTDKESGEVYRDYFRLYAPAGSELRSAVGDFRPPAEREFLPTDPEFKTLPLLAATIGGARSGPGGTEIWEEGGRTVFGNWFTIAPGESASATFVYRSGAKILPARRGLFASFSGEPVASYRLRLEKQPGSNVLAAVSVTPSEGYRTVWSSPALEAENGRAAALLGDRFYGLVFFRE
ncbi:DUF4012 domain-containing protein [Patescibacteria group bacterium]|nr:MAG: DUF4012 domain-containing protein [Patescibacteria group bacterium]